MREIARFVMPGRHHLDHLRMIEVAAYKGRANASTASHHKHSQFAPLEQAIKCWLASTVGWQSHHHLWPSVYCRTASWPGLA